MDPAGSISCVEEDEELARRPDIRRVLRPWPAEGREREGVRSGDGGHERIMSKEESVTGGRQVVLCTLWFL
jgi:hypothetical protein